MRDTRKDEAYFSGYIAYQRKRIQRGDEELQQCGATEKDKRNRVLISLVHYKADLMLAQFSAGADDVEMAGCIQSVGETLAERDSCDYETFLQFFSMAVLYEQTDVVKTVLAKHKQYIQSDKLLQLFAGYLTEGKTVWQGGFIIDGIYDELDALFAGGNDTAEVLLRYLEGWYENHEDAAWYECADSFADIYVGYWCLECAALAKILNVDEGKLKENAFYPVK